MELTIQTQFATIYNHMAACQHDMKDISEIIRLVRDNKINISDAAARELIQIPLAILKTEQVKIKDNNAWSQSEGGYFAGNCATTGKMSEFKKIFETCNFDLSLMTEFLEFIISDNTLLKSDFYLRNIEVTFRKGYLMATNSTFAESGAIYANAIKKAFDL